MIDTNKQLSASEVARALGVCRDTVYRMAREGSIGATRVRGQWRISAPDLQQYMTDNRNLPHECDNS